jgi:DNA-binding HxlR family transcriptional regulator
VSILLTLLIKDELGNNSSQVVWRKILSMKNDINNDHQLVIKTENEDFSEVNCPMTNTLDIIGGKWKLLLLNKVREECPMRFGVLRKRMPYITQATLTAQLRELERDGVISREAFAESPPRVEYKLTEIGKSLIPIMDALVDWGIAYCQIKKDLNK